MKITIILSCLLSISFCGSVQAQISENDDAAVAEEVCFPKFQNGDHTYFKEWFEGQITPPDYKTMKKFKEEPVSVLFDIDGATGKIGNVNIVSHPNKKFAEQIYAVIEKSPNWTPASNGETFRFYLQIDPFTREIIVMPYLLSAIERAPVFLKSGGIREFHLWIRNNIGYPRGALIGNISGRVAVNFYVDIYGRTQSITELYSPHPQLTQEVERTIKKSPLWIPGTMNGMPVPVSFTISVGFEHFKLF